MNDPDKLDELRRKYEEICGKLRLPEVQARMRLDGLDASAEVTRLDRLFTELLRTDAMVQENNEKVLHAMADVADTMRDLYHVTKKLVAELEAAYPFHPQLENIRDLLEVLSYRMPKEDLG